MFVYLNILNLKSWNSIEKILMLQINNNNNLLSTSKIKFIVKIDV